MEDVKSSTISPDTTFVKTFFTRNKTLLFFILKLVIAAGLLIYLASSIEYKQILSGIENADLVLLMTAFVLSFLNIFLQYYKWKMVSESVLQENKKSKIFISLFHGFSAGIITPLRVGEYFGRAISFKDKPLVQVTIATLIDKFFPLMLVAFFGSVSSILYLYFLKGISVYLALSLFIILFSLFYFFASLMLSRRFWDGMLFSRIRRSGRVSSWLEKLKVLKQLDKPFFFKMSFVSLLFYLCFLVQYALLVSAFSHNQNFFDYLWAGNLIMFVKTIIPPISLGELGIREGASVYFLSQMGETSVTAFNASIFLFVINLLIPSLVGLILLFRRNGN